MEWITWVDYIGTFVFAVSGMMAAIDHKLDLFGILILGFVTALGGGTLRDLLIGSAPVTWLQNEVYFYIVTAALPLCLFFKPIVFKLRKGIFLFDTIGIALFTILGMEKTLNLGLPMTSAVLMGIVSAVFGGVIRDVLSNEVPLIFRKEIYASACLAGALTHLLMSTMVPNNVSMLIAMSVVVAVRVIAIKRNWSLQVAR